MEVALLDKTSLRIKSKSSNFVVDPFEKMTKTPADAVIILAKDDVDFSRVLDFRVIIKSPGEYEVGGVKVSGIDLDGNTVYDLKIDNIGVLLAKSSSLSKVSEKLKEYEIVICQVDGEINQSVITALEPRVVVFYGEKAEEASKSLGNVSSQTLQKYSATEDKLPEEMQVIVLK